LASAKVTADRRLGLIGSGGFAIFLGFRDFRH